MAALDRRNPNLDDFVGLNWSCWVDRVNILSSDVNVEDSNTYGSNCETMTLRKEDMHTFGHCPAHDELYLVVCSHCGQVVKPQAFEKHYERRHGPLIKTCGQSSTLAPQQRPRPARPTSNHSSSRERQKESRGHESSAASPVHQHRPSKAQKEAVSFPSVEKFPQENAPLPHRSSSSSSSSPRPRVPPCHSGPLPPGHSSTSPSERPSVQKPSAVQSSESNSPLRGTRTYSRIYKNITKKECDLNKQCGGLVPERKKLCSRELICNTDSIHQQQKALGRTKTLDQLAEEQKTASAGGEMEQPLVKSKDKEQHLGAVEGKITTQSRKTFTGNCHSLRSEESLENAPEKKDDHIVEVEEIPQYPLNQSLLSSEESEDDEQDEATDLPATAWHPKPLGLCTFGCRTLGCSIFTFNRRLHHLRFALSTMLERHVSTHLWKKVPQVSSGLRSCHVTPPAVGSPGRTGVRPFKSTGSLSLESTSMGQNKTSQYNSHSVKPLSSTTSARLGPVRRRNPARLRKEEAQMAAKLSHGGEDKSSKYIRDPPLNEKGQPHIPSSTGPVNGSFSHGKKPCPPLHSSPCSRVRPPGIQQEVVSYDHRGLAQKRKGSNAESTLLSSSLSKCQRLSSPPQRGERISGTCKHWAWKKHPSPKDQ